MTSSTTSSSRSRNHSSGVRSTPDRFAHSPSPSYSESSASQKSGSGRNPVTVAARSIAGAFVACFTPPETADSKNFGVSDEFGAPSVASDTSRTKSEGRELNRGIYSNSTKERATGSMKFTMEEIFKATRNFSPAFKVGQGGFGTVYKGRLDDGTFVAIKRAKKSVYDKHLGVEFQSEIKTLAQVEHLNLVKFYGYLEHGDERIVVVEYVPNGTLREHLDGVQGKFLDLASRLDIAIDAIKNFTDGDAISALDPKLELTAGTNLALEKILELALQCLAPRRQSRPSMRRCGEILWSIRKDYREQSAFDIRSLSSNSQRSASVREN
ncbi:Protein kinase domain - like 10 [Theobroma cacao]|nr:Protein kinase domain - like 10 [Theobroma cacao]